MLLEIEKALECNYPWPFLICLFGGEDKINWPGLNIETVGVEILWFFDDTLQADNFFEVDGLGSFLTVLAFEWK